MTSLPNSDAPRRCSPRLNHWRWQLLASILSLVLVMGLASPALALSQADFPKEAPAALVLDEGHVLSRASAQDIEHALQAFADERVDAKLITVAKLDYGLSLHQLGEGLLAQWGQGGLDNGRDGERPARLLLLIDAQTRSTAVVASKGLNGRLPADLLESTADTTMAMPLRSADRYRQASLDALSRLSTVLMGGEDPGEPAVEEAPAVVSNIPSKEETESSHAFRWIVVLLVIGTVVPMATWWVFSR